MNDNDIPLHTRFWWWFWDEGNVLWFITAIGMICLGALLWHSTQADRQGMRDCIARCEPYMYAQWNPCYCDLTKKRTER